MSTVKEDKPTIESTWGEKEQTSAGASSAAAAAGAAATAGPAAGIAIS